MLFVAAPVEPVVNERAVYAATAVTALMVSLEFVAPLSWNRAELGDSARLLATRDFREPFFGSTAPPPFHSQIGLELSLAITLLAELAVFRGRPCAEHPSYSLWYHVFWLLWLVVPCQVGRKGRTGVRGVLAVGSTSAGTPARNNSAPAGRDR